MSSVEIERKFIIELPDFEKMREMSGYTFYDITQVYMPTENGVSHRIRKRIGMRDVVYTETKKRRIDGMSAYEDEAVITKERYDELCRNAATIGKEVRRGAYLTRALQRAEALLRA